MAAAMKLIYSSTLYQSLQAAVMSTGIRHKHHAVDRKYFGAFTHSTREWPTPTK